MSSVFFYCMRFFLCFFLFFFNDTATTEIYTLSLHDALPICAACKSERRPWGPSTRLLLRASTTSPRRSEEHTSELQSLAYLVCRLLLEKKKKRQYVSIAHDPQRRNQTVC